MSLSERERKGSQRLGVSGLWHGCIWHAGVSDGWDYLRVVYGLIDDLVARRLPS